MDLLDSLEKGDHLERQDSQDPGEKVDQLVLKDVLDLLDPKELLVIRDLLVLWDSQDKGVSLVLRELKEAGVTKDQQDLLDLMAGLEREANRALQDPLVPLAKLGAPETLDQLDLLESRVPLV